MQMNLQRGLVGHWTMDSVDTSNGVLYDQSPYDNHATISDATTDQPSPIGAAFDFDASNDILDVGSTTSVPQGGPLTISFWIYPRNNPQDWAMPVSIEDNSSTNDIWSIIHDDGGNSWTGKLGIRWRGTDTNSSNVPVNEWTHFTAVRKNGTSYVYTNGTQDNSNSYTEGASGAAHLTIGGGNTTPEYIIDGLLSDVRIYDRALSDSEINALYNTRSSRTYGSPHVPQRPVAASDLVAWYPFEGKASDATAYQHWAADDSDYAGTVNGATYQANGGVTDIRRGNGSGSYMMDANLEYIGLPERITLSSYTVSVSVNPDTSVSTQAFVTDKGGAGSGFYLHDYNNSKYVGFRGLSGTRYNWDGSNNTQEILYANLSGSWNHISFVSDGTDIYCYINGVENGYITPSDASLEMEYIGSDRDSGHTFFGTIDDVRIYNSELSESEISRIYANTKP